MIRLLRHYLNRRHRAALALAGWHIRAAEYHGLHIKDSRGRKRILAEQRAFVHGVLSR